MRYTTMLKMFGIILVTLLPGMVFAQTLEKGIALLDQKKYAEAKSIFEQLIEQNKNDAEAHYRLGFLFYDRRNKDRDIEKSVDELETAVELNPNNADYQFFYGAALGEKTQNAGVIKQAFLAPKIKKAFARAVELNPKLVRARIALAQYCLIAPSIVGGDEKLGWEQLEEAIKLDELVGRLSKAQFLERAKKTSDADKEYQILLASKSTEWRVWKNYGYFNLHLKKDDEAVRCFQKYVGLKPDTADSHQSLAEALLQKGEVDRAEELLNKSLSIDRDFFPAILSLGDVYKAKGKLKEAKETYQWALSVAQNDWSKKQAEEKLKTCR